MTKKHIYKVTGHCTSVSGSYFDNLKEAFRFIELLKQGYKGDPERFYANIHVKDARVVQWDEASYAVQNHYEFKMDEWVEAGMPTEVLEREEDNESELVQ